MILFVLFLFINVKRLVIFGLVNLFKIFIVLLYDIFFNMWLVYVVFILLNSNLYLLLLIFNWLKKFVIFLGDKYWKIFCLFLLVVFLKYLFCLYVCNVRNLFLNWLILLFFKYWFNNVLLYNFFWICFFLFVFIDIFIFFVWIRVDWII